MGSSGGFQLGKGGTSRGSSRGSSAKRWFRQGSGTGFQRRNGFQQEVPAGVPINTYLSLLFPCISTQMPLLATLVDWAKAARAAVGTRGHAGPDGLGCTDLAAHPDTKVVIPPGTTITRIRLTRPLLAADNSLAPSPTGCMGSWRTTPTCRSCKWLYADDVDDVIQACTGRANPTVNKTQRHHVVMEGTPLLFAARKPTTKKAGKDKYPLRHPHLNTLRYVVDSKPAMSLPNYSLTSHSPYHWKLELVGLTTPVMESEDAVLPLPKCHALPLIGTSDPVKQVDIFREVNGELSELGETGHVFKEEFLAKDGDALANMKIEADSPGQRWGGIFNVAWPSPNGPLDPGDKAAVYATIPMGNGGQEGLQLPHVVLWAPRVLQGLSTKYPGLCR